MVNSSLNSVCEQLPLRKRGSLSLHTCFRLNHLVALDDPLDSLEPSNSGANREVDMSEDDDMDDSLDGPADGIERLELIDSQLEMAAETLRVLAHPGETTDVVSAGRRGSHGRRPGEGQWDP